ncbi:hypothetical protein HYDPIDRAFT_29550 [Hydnomerulius pinastri MD-312]|uniref:Ricin B lectin domain-containing protein n=1 Tax=Hydnomerulius pinastri MD-312 TaxID=994086 RepID=A0A0C9WDR5_9AGAM|nr:hypothetical protein HYDPIDRAFT_29550 [Hydnomerulius pinastri MD-312]
MSVTIPTGTYLIKNANDGSYMTVANTGGAGIAVTLDYGTNTSGEIWNVTPTANGGYTIQNYGNGYFLTPSGTGVTTEDANHTWLIPTNSQIVYTFSIQDASSVANGLGMDSQTTGTPVLYEALSNNDNRQCWYFLAKEPVGA